MKAPPRPRGSPARLCLMALLILTITLNTRGAQGGDVHQEPACSKGCRKHGTCAWNPATKKSECRCPNNLHGEDCETVAVPACRMHPTKDTDYHCGDWLSKACQCHKQCHASEWWHGSKSCYVRTNLSDAEQYSDVPAIGEPNVKWYTHWDPNDPHARAKEVPAEMGVTLPFGPRSAEKIVPLSECKKSCNYRGGCINTGRYNRCACYYGYEGEACEYQRKDSCWRGCSGNGTCLGGFCKCNPGHYGIDCFRCGEAGKEASEENKAAGQQVKLRIYIYDLPTELNVRRETDRVAGWQYHDGIYVAYRRFFWRFLHDCSVRTDDPEEANLFYVPAFSYGHSSNGPYPGPHIEKVLQHIREKYPYWDRRGGRDHIWWLSNDWGPCSAPESIHQSIKMGHWGPMSSREFMDTMHIEPLWRRCFDPLRDVVVPPNLDKGPFLVQALDKAMKDGKHKEPRSTLFFFAGGLLMDRPKYSMGVRQQLWNTMRAQPGFKMYERSPNYVKDLQGSTFCLHPSGAGWGIRIVVIMAYGCIPVIIQPHVVQPFQDVLPYWKFSVVLAKEQIPEMPKILRSYSHERVVQMREDMRVYLSAFYWDKRTGSAYEYTLLSLEKRMRALHGFEIAKAPEDETGGKGRRGPFRAPKAPAEDETGGKGRRGPFRAPKARGGRPLFIIPRAGVRAFSL